MAYGIPGKKDLDIHVIARDSEGNEFPLTVSEFESHIDFSTNKIVVRILIEHPRSTK